MAVEIPLTRGMVALVDDEDAERVGAVKWYANPDGEPPSCRWYAIRDRWEGGRRVRERLHRIILDAPAGALVDHVNGDGLDNRRANLRLCSGSQNGANKRCSVGRSGFRGVYPARARWYASIQHRSLGTFADPVDAARAYDAAAQAIYGPFARLNFPSEAD